MKRNERIAFYDLDEERLVLGTLLNDPDKLLEVSNILDEACFYHDFHKQIFRVIKDLDKKGKKFDFMVVKRELRGGINEEKDTPLFFEIVGQRAYTNLYEHAAILKDASARRQIEDNLKNALSLIPCVTEDPFEIIEKVRNALDGIYSDQTSGVITLREALEGAYEIIKKNLNNPDASSGTPTGFRELDRRGILKPGYLTVVAADSSQGKTSLATSFCVNAAMSGAKQAFYTMEMSPVELSQRILSKTSGVNGVRIASAQLTAEEFSMIDKGFAPIYNLPLYFDGKSTSTIDSIISSIRMMKKRYDIDGAIVDYLQILSANSNSGSGDEMQLGIFARRLKNIAKDLGIWILALSQLSRDKVDVAPSISRIRGSGQITEAADVVLLLYRPEHYGRDKKYPEPFSNVSTENTAMIDIAKGRSIGTWKFICGFNAETTQFYDLLDIPHINPSASSEEKPF